MDKRCTWCGKAPTLMYVDLDIAKPKDNWYRGKKGILCYEHLSTSDMSEISTHKGAVVTVEKKQ